MTTSELIEEEVTEVIDTIDMVPVSSLTSSKRSGDAVNQDDSGKTSLGNGSNWSPLGSKTSPRSLDQCLAEQEELLRRMMLSASGMRQQNSSKPGSGTLGNSGCGTSGGVQSTKSRPDVTLYED
ncbi:hypothetical protein GN244_ATG07819 [Phytophthora infestans]|nr:hypothetical protein GN244_ATG07819 [Phytophthora infestans]